MTSVSTPITPEIHEDPIDIDMKAIMLMFDSLNRHLLPPYSPEARVHAPNFSRLARQGVTFDHSYVCSMPCMPARRDLHTGRPNFLHRSWGPLEPFDDSVMRMLGDAGVYTHLASDHDHYWQDGGATYHGRYHSWQFIRGQEGDPHIGQVEDPPIPWNINATPRRADWVNRQHIKCESDIPQTQLLNAGLDFIVRNHASDRWFLQLEFFDPHEPFVADQKFKDLYPSDYSGPLFDWPPYDSVNETPEEVDEARRNYAALTSQCDASLGAVLDAMDRYGLWGDTMLIVWADHGYSLGEHGCWAKNWMPLYEEVAHTPFFMYDPRGKTAGERRSALVQPAIDLGPTLLDYFEVPLARDMTGQALRSVIEEDAPVRDAAIFGYHGDRINVTDGRYVYMRYPLDKPYFEYTLMPTKKAGFLEIESLRRAELVDGFSFTKGVPVLKIPASGKPPAKHQPKKHMLFDLQKDPKQKTPLDDLKIEERMVKHMQSLMKALEAPTELYARMGFPESGNS